jgi:hypothetical protein
MYSPLLDLARMSIGSLCTVKDRCVQFGFIDSTNSLSQ